ncbi:MAG: hypothetical protein SVY53_13315 [Chloroflexota bacterium]|nr:hypothetical protein [Chloroflexota bacterium]
MRDRRYGRDDREPPDDRGRYGRGGGERHRDDIRDTAGRFVEDAVEGLGRILGGGQRGRGPSHPAASICDAIDMEREALERLGIITGKDYDRWLDTLQRVHSTLSRRSRDADLAYGLESFLDELKEERREFKD